MGQPIFLSKVTTPNLYDLKFVACHPLADGVPILAAVPSQLKADIELNKLVPGIHLSSPYSFFKDDPLLFLSITQILKTLLFDATQ
jgi:hypothetical protein